MSPFQIILVLALYFGLLLLVSYLRGRKSDADTFYLGNRNAPWPLVAIGMIGASLSGVTFISVPGWVGSTAFGYMQTVLGYMLGYAVIAGVLLPLYYRMNLTSIYTYLEHRFGFWSYKTGAAFFMLSRVIGASFRLFLVANVLQLAIFSPLGLPYWLAVALTILLIFTYTFKSGIGTIIYTDVLQTLFLVAAVIATIWYITGSLGIGIADLPAFIREQPESKLFHFDANSSNNFWKQFIGGGFIALCMTGLDQDMMQKNLSVNTLKHSQKNILLQMILFITVNIIFLSLGVLLYAYARGNGIEIPEKTDELFPLIALQHASPLIALFFIVGLTAAAYSSADSALTALTTSFCVDFLQFGSKKATNTKVRTMVHIGFAILLYGVILLFREINNGAVIKELFMAAGLTYGPLLGLFFFGILMPHQINDRAVPWICIAAPILSYLIQKFSPSLFGGYQVGFELLPINGIITFTAIWLFSQNKSQEKHVEEDIIRP